MPTKSSIIKDKLTYYGKPFIQQDLLQQIIDRWVPNYTIAEACKRKLITPIKRGTIYYNNFSSYSPSWYAIGAAYFGDKIYMFGGLNIYNRYHFTTQIAERYTIYNTEFSGKRIIAGARFIFKQVRPSFFYGIKKQKVDGYTVSFMSPERALIELFKKTDDDEFVKTLPTNVDKNTIMKMIKNHSSHKVLQRVTRLIDDKKTPKR